MLQLEDRMVERLKKGRLNLNAQVLLSLRLKTILADGWSLKTKLWSITLIFSLCTTLASMPEIHTAVITSVYVINSTFDDGYGN